MLFGRVAAFRRFEVLFGWVPRFSGICQSVLTVFVNVFVHFVGIDQVSSFPRWFRCDSSFFFATVDFRSLSKVGSFRAHRNFSEDRFAPLTPSPPPVPPTLLSPLSLRGGDLSTKIQ